jgi:hypothetical protein
MHSYSTEDLRQRLAAGTVVPVIGAGVSISTARMPTWREAITSALSHALAVGCASEEERSEVQDLLDQGALVPAAQRVKSLLGAPTGEYPFWLKSTFGGAKNAALSPRVINAVADLMCPLVATTNYDRLLTEVIPDHPEPITWREPVAMREALQEGGRVLHLHGVYTDPLSVVFGLDNYDDLTSNDAYQAVLRSLWLGKTLLFIGCSFGGMRDPDFTKLLDWAAATFAGSPAKHYALIWQDEASAREIRDFLQRWRIQIVPYGPTREDLMTTLNDLNPNREQAVARRVRLINKILEGSSVELRGDLINILGGLPLPGKQHLADMSALADALLQKEHHTADQLRNDLTGLQQLARSMIDPALLDQEIQRYHEGAIQDYTGSFREAVTASSAVLALFPPALLNALQRRRVDVHSSWLSGYCRETLEFLESLKELEDRRGVKVPPRPYRLENAKRILTSLRAVLNAEPERLFQRPLRGTPLLPGDEQPYLLVARTGRLELRRPATPLEIKAELPLSTALPVDGVDIVTFDGAAAVCGFDSEHVFVWDPTRANAPMASYAVSEAYGISGVAHLPGDTSLRSLVVTMGPIYDLLDFKLQRAWKPVSRAFFTDPVLLEDDSLYALVEDMLPLVRVELTEDHAHPRTVVSAESLSKALQAIPPLAFQIERRLAEDRSYNERSGWKDDQEGELDFQHSELSTVRVGDETLLVLYLSIHFRTAISSLVLLLRPERDGARIEGHFYLDDQIISNFKFAEGPEGRLLLVYGLLADFEVTRDLVGWARATHTTSGTIFVQEGSSSLTSEDIICVALADHERGFASDDRGGLFSFSLDKRSGQEIDRDRHSRIHALKMVAW